MKNNILEKTNKAIAEAQSNALISGHRLPVVICSESKFIENFCETFAREHSSYIIVTPDSTLKANDIIGHEYNAVLFYLHEQFNANLMAAISGTIKSGGLFILLLPRDKKNTESEFYKYVLAATNKDPFFCTIETSGDDIVTSQQKTPTEVNYIENEERFSAQNNLIEKIKKVATGRRKKPLTITANRGRGKSAALGIAIGELINLPSEHKEDESLNIIITAPSLAAASVIFKHINLTIFDTTSKKFFDKNKRVNKSHISHKNNRVNFVAPDKLISDYPEADLLIVDEAAGISIFTLTSLLKHYPKIIFATTLHGYEGSGQGFITRFSKTLDAVTPQWKPATLKQPIRWHSNDPLEAFIEKTFMLESSESIEFNSRFSSENLTNRIINRDELLNNTNLLRSLFSLLKSAHYKTSPNDLRQLMDSENSVIFSSHHNNTLVAAAIIEKEGNLEDSIIEDIYHGYRRPKGEFIPQSIVMHLGLKEAAKLRYLRIMRIAVTPSLQGKKIGTALLSFITQFGRENSFDFIGCSFGATNQLLNFWYKHGFHALRLGYTKNNFSGCNAALLIKPLSQKTNTLTEASDLIFSDNFTAQLSDSLRELDANLVTAILENIYTKKKVKNDITEKVLHDVISFTHHNRSYDDNLYSIKHFLTNTESLNCLSSTESALIILKVFQNYSWSEVSEKMGLTGKKASISSLKSSLAKILDTRF